MEKYEIESIVNFRLIIFFLIFITFHWVLETLKGKKDKKFEIKKKSKIEILISKFKRIIEIPLFVEKFVVGKFFNRSLYPKIYKKNFFFNLKLYDETDL